MKTTSWLVLLALATSLTGRAVAGEGTNVDGKAATLSRSQTIESAWYDASTKALVICFHRSGSYRFSDVPEEVYRSFITAESLGRAFHTLLRGRYPSRRIIASDLEAVATVAATPRKAQKED